MIKKYSFLFLTLIGVEQARAEGTMAQVLKQIGPQIDAFLQSNEAFPNQGLKPTFEGLREQGESLAKTLENRGMLEDIDLEKSFIDFPLQEVALNNLVLQALDHPHAIHLIKQGDEQLKKDSQESKFVEKESFGPFVGLIGDLVSSINQEKARTQSNVNEGKTFFVTQQKKSRAPLAQKGNGPLIVKKHVVVFDPLHNTKSEINMIQTSLEQPEHSAFSTQKSQTTMSAFPMLKREHKANKGHTEKQHHKKSKISSWKEVRHDQPNVETISFEIPLEILSV